MSLHAEVPEIHLPSPYAEAKIPVKTHLAMSAYWFATNFLWGAMLTIMLPHQIKYLVPEFRALALGLFTALAAIVALVVPLATGAYSDRSHHPLGRRRPFMIGGVAINAIGLGVMAVSFAAAKPIIYPGAPGFKPEDIPLTTVVGFLMTNGTFMLFLLAFMIVQLGNNISTAAYSGLIPDLIPEDQRGIASGYMAMMSQIGTLFGVVSAGVLLGSQSELVKYAVISVVLILVAAITVFGIKETPHPEKLPPIKWGPYIKSLWISPKKYPDFAWVWITRALVMLGFYAILPFINYYLVDVIDIPKPDGPAAMLTAIIIACAAVSGIYGGHLSDRIGRKRVVYIANMIIAVMALGFIFCRTFNHVLIVGVLFGIGYGAYVSVDWALGTDVLPTKNNAAKELGVWHIAMTLPQSISSPIAGILIGAWGSSKSIVEGETVVHYSTSGYSAVFILAAVCFALGAFLLRNVRGVT